MKTKLDQWSEKKNRQEYSELKEEMKRICKAKRELKNGFNSAYRADL